MVLSPKGKLIVELDHYNFNDGDEAVSYDNVIRFYNWNPVFVRYNCRNGENVWTTKIDKLDNVQSDSRITMTVVEKKGQLWKYRCDIVNKDGSKAQFDLQVDTESGELIYL